MTSMERNTCFVESQFIASRVGSDVRKNQLTVVWTLTTAQETGWIMANRETRQAADCASWQENSRQLLCCSH